VAGAARRLGLRPFRLPLAINYEARDERGACVRCMTCDGFACAVRAKNDLATCVIAPLVRAGLELRANTVAVALRADGGRVRALECVDRVTGERSTVRAARYVLAAGALATPHLLLASGLDRASPAPRVVGRYLMRHRNAMVFGVFARRPNPAGEFHKQVGIHDFYRGHPGGEPRGPIGGIQQITSPPPSVVRAMFRKPLTYVLAAGVPYTMALLTIAEDQPRAENGVRLDASRQDRFGLPQLVVCHRYTRRDVAAGRVLIDAARRVVRAAGAVADCVYHIRTFAHALGTVRMGPDARRSALDADGRYRGLANLYVADGSALPTAAAVNPSLTIAACALRLGARLTGASAPRALHAAAVRVVRAPMPRAEPVGD
jgi:choline dehydrogenase-like flavoprotein